MRNIISLVNENIIKPVVLLGLVLNCSFLYAQEPPNEKMPAKTIIWQIDNPAQIGKFKTSILGQPVVRVDEGDEVLFFDGVDDGLIVPEIPIQGWTKFSIEVLFKPAGDGPVAPRFIHFQDTEDNRCTFELRITPNKMWYLDTFLKNGKAGDRGLALIDSTLLYPTDQWYWAALTYDGKKMVSYVNGIKQLEGETNFVTTNEDGSLSIGVRLNKVNWFKGLIGEIRFHPEVLTAKTLQKKTNK
ncbi:LamG domain-containing protein [Pedobacter sp. P351]|uniref:LamG domain-containing protein n=1 Tax=Pedobacter superstes TaxID=3133441 RepID=UPI0030AAB937